MTESGWERGDDGIWTKGDMRYSVKVTYSFDGHTPRLVLLKEEAKKAGIEMNLQRLDGSAMFKLILEKSMMLVGWAGAPLFVHATGKDSIPTTRIKRKPTTLPTPIVLNWTG